MIVRTHKIAFALVACLICHTSVALGQSGTNPYVKTIFDYRQELNLTERQEQEIKSILSQLSQEMRVTRAKLTLLEVEANDLIKKDGDLELIRKRIKDAAEIQVDLKMADITATRKINSVMSSEQLKKWRALQAAAAQR